MWRQYLGLLNCDLAYIKQSFPRTISFDRNKFVTWSMQFKVNVSDFSTTQPVSYLEISMILDNILPGIITLTQL